MKNYYAIINDIAEKIIKRYKIFTVNDQDDQKPPTISRDLRIAIAQARNSKGWTQEQFDHLLCIPKSEVNDWQSGGKDFPQAFKQQKWIKIQVVKLPRPNKN